MDTIEKALNKQKQQEQLRQNKTGIDAGVSSSDSDSVRVALNKTQIEEIIPDIDEPQEAIAPALVKRIPSPSGFTENYLEINFSSLQLLGVIHPDEKRSKVKEEYKHIKRPLLQRVAKKNPGGKDSNLVMVTSAYSGEGKTFTALNLALSIAVERDRRVLLVDADVVKPGLGGMLGINHQRGLVDYLNGEVSALTDILFATNVNNMTLLPAGKTHHLSHELLASNAMRDLARELSDRYPDRIIILDSPPLLITSEAKVLAQLADQIVFVVEQDKTSQKALKDAIAAVDKEKITGLILNKYKGLGMSDAYYGYYYYGAKGGRAE